VNRIQTPDRDPVPYCLEGETKCDELKEGDDAVLLGRQPPSLLCAH
jgi:hypothetical protein